MTKLVNIDVPGQIIAPARIEGRSESPGVRYKPLDQATRYSSSSPFPIPTYIVINNDVLEFCEFSCRQTLFLRQLRLLVIPFVRCRQHLLLKVAVTLSIPGIVSQAKHRPIPIYALQELKLESGLGHRVHYPVIQRHVRH